MHNVMFGVNIFMSFFVRFLVFELLSILYFILVNSDLDVAGQGNIA